MWPNPLETADLVTFTEEILNGQLQFLGSVGLSITEWYIAKMVSTAQQADDTKGRNMNYMS